jgi:hypothetical protein
MFSKVNFAPLEGLEMRVTQVKIKGHPITGHPITGHPIQATKRLEGK